MEEFRIIEMNLLTPVSLTWQSSEGQSGTVLAFLDFVSEKAYSADGTSLVGPIGDAVVDVIRQKKEDAFAIHDVHPLVEEAMEKNSKLRGGHDVGYESEA